MIIKDNSPIRQEHKTGVWIWNKLNIRKEEGPVFCWSFFFIFTVMFSYYILRPVRDTVGITGGIKHLPWLFLGTMLTTLVLNIPFAMLVKRLPRRKFIRIVYGFFSLVIILFACLLAFPAMKQNVWLGRIFFIWISVYNLYILSLFWQYMVDIFRPEQSKRMFGIFTTGITLGALAGSGFTSLTAAYFPEYCLVLVSGILLGTSLFFVEKIGQLASGNSATPAQKEDKAVIGGSVWKGFATVFRSRYLLCICLYMLVYSITSTLLYMQQADLVSKAYNGGMGTTGKITSFFAHIDLMVNLLALVLGTFITARLLRKIGIKYTLGILPFICVVGFLLLALYPSLLLLSLFQILRRSGDYAIARPSRELLFTVISREDKYKTKSVIDTGVYRLGDQTGVWSSTLLKSLGFTAFFISFIGVALSILWMLDSWWLGMRQHKIEAEKEKTAVPGLHSSGISVPKITRA